MPAPFFFFKFMGKGFECQESFPMNLKKWTKERYRHGRKTPMLSIGMIVKNEEKKLERCLTALQPLRDAIPCELVIADTGSTDGTRAIAERYADMVFDIQWTNDFSAARNAVMDRAHGTWYFTVDADEYLDADITEVVNFLTGPQSQKSMYANRHPAQLYVHRSVR